MMPGKNLLIGIFSVLLVVLASSTARAKVTVNPSCASDADKLCSIELKKGDEGAVFTCLEDRESDLSRDCRSFVEERSACQSDLGRYCRGKLFENDYKTCLMRRDADLAKNCRTRVMQTGDVGASGPAGGMRTGGQEQGMRGGQEQGMRGGQEQGMRTGGQEQGMTRGQEQGTTRGQEQGTARGQEQDVTRGQEQDTYPEGTRSQGQMTRGATVTPPAAAPSGTEPSPAKLGACATDYQRVCGDQPINDEQKELECLKSHQVYLSQACRNDLERRGDPYGSGVIMSPRQQQTPADQPQSPSEGNPIR